MTEQTGSPPHSSELSSDQADRVIELMPGVPWASVDELNRLLRQQGLCLAVAQASVFDDIAQAISIEPSQEQELVQRWLEQQGFTDQAEIDSWLSSKGWNQEDLIYFATKGHRIELFKSIMFSQEIEVRFLEKKLEFDQVRYSLIRVSDESTAFELYHRLIDDGDDFAAIASEFSEGPERDTGGSIGPFPLNQAHEAVAEQLRISEIGRVWEPFFLVNIWVILRLDQRIEAKLDDEMRRELLDDLFFDWMDKRVAQLLRGETLPTLSFLIDSIG